MTRACLLVLVGTLLGAATAGESASSSSRHADASALRLQACVDRWNWMHFAGWFGTAGDRSVPVRVEADPCRVEVAYGTRRRDRPFFFPCSVNRLGAYVCASHAHGLPSERPRRGHNALYFVRTGRIRLDRPPALPQVTPKPEWVRRYPVDHSFIVPFDSHGRLRPGLTLRGPVELGCSTFASIRHRSRLLGCGAGLYCFIPRLPVRDGMRLACAFPGSRVFRKGRLRVHS